MLRRKAADVPVLGAECITPAQMKNGWEKAIIDAAGGIDKNYGWHVFISVCVIVAATAYAAWPS